MESCGLTFDWDDVSIDDAIVNEELNLLCDEFGDEFVWYRISSSGAGLHILIGKLILDTLGEFKVVPLPMSPERQMGYRKKVELECKGRFFSDSMRQKAGLRISRIFNIKNGTSVGEWRRFK